MMASSLLLAVTGGSWRKSPNINTLIPPNALSSLLMKDPTQDAFSKKIRRYHRYFIYDKYVSVLPIVL